MEPPETVKDFLEKENLNLKVVFDRFGKVSAQYNVRSHPIKFLIDGQGKLMATGLGFRDWDSEEMNKLVNILIQQAGEIPNPGFSQRPSREVGECCGYKARAEKHPQAYLQYVENVFQA